MWVPISGLVRKGEARVGPEPDSRAGKLVQLSVYTDGGRAWCWDRFNNKRPVCA